MLEKATQLMDQLNRESIPMGDIKAMAKVIKKDHALALDLWSTGQYYPRLLAVLILDKKELTQPFIESMINDLASNSEKDALRISEWLLANQLMKSKRTIALLESYQHHELPMLRRLFWYHQARLRWTGKTAFDNTQDLVETLERDMAKEEAVVQWTMNLTAGWIGVFEPSYRERCVQLGKKLGLYEEEVALAPKGCTPSYLPAFIQIETDKRK